MSNNRNDYDDLGGLSTRALLCGLSISTWGNRKQDKEMGREASKAKGMGEDVGRYNKWLLIQNRKGTPAEEYSVIVRARNKAEAVHREATLPWMDNGQHICSAQNFNDWCLAMREQKNVFDAAVEHFLREYPQLVLRTRQIMDDAAEEEREERRLKGKPDDKVKSMFNGANYPSLAEMKRKFSFNTSVLPLPDQQDFRVNLGDSQVNSIKEQIKAHISGQVMNATQHLFERLSELVGRVTLLGDPKSTLQKALVRDIEQITGIVERLNIAGDSYLDEFAKRIRKELLFEPVMLKTCTGERELLAARAQSIKRDMQSFMGGYSDD